MIRKEPGAAGEVLFLTALSVTPFTDPKKTFKNPHAYGILPSVA